MSEVRDDQLRNKGYEEMVLGAMMIEELNPIIPSLMPILKDEKTFFTTDHKIIYKGITDCYNRHRIVDPVLVAKEIGDDNINRAGGFIHLNDLREKCVETPETAIIIANELRELRERRESKVVFQSAATDIIDLDKPLLNIHDNISQHILRRDSTKPTGSQPLTTTIKSTLDWIQAVGSGEIPPGLKTGFHSLDKITTGLQPSEFIIIGARPRIGKSTLVANIAQNIAALYQKSTLLFSLEMSNRQITTRILSSESNIPMGIIRTGKFNREQLDSFTDTANNLSTRRPQIFIDDNPQDIQSLRMEARRIAAERDDLALIIVDYLQLLKPDTSNRNYGRIQEVGDISRGLKKLAQELEIPVIACSQLNRAAETDPAIIPDLKHLRESGDLEQDADIVAILHRPPKGDDQDTGNDLILYDLAIRKNRNGPEGIINLLFQPQTVTFTNANTIDDANSTKESEGNHDKSGWF